MAIAGQQMFAGILKNRCASLDGAIDMDPESLLVCGGQTCAVNEMCVKGTAPHMGHVQRAHRVNIEWVFERILTDQGISTRYVNTKLQLADIFIKGSFTTQAWNSLCQCLHNASPFLLIE